jgi:type IV pilus assembly protein PilN
MRITLNLATRPYADLEPVLKRLSRGIIALAVFCICLAIGLHLVHSKAEQARTQELSLDGRLTQVHKERAGYMALMQRPDNVELLNQTGLVNQLIDQKSFSWTLAMESLETVLPAGVQVTTLEPVRDKDGHITLHLRVVGPQNLSVDLVRNLEHSRRFEEPRIVGENAEESSSGANQQLTPVSASNRFDFDILADYNPPTAEEIQAAKNAAKKQNRAAGEAPAATNAEAAPGTNRALGNRMQRPPQRGAR